jgi:hypothetical protein
MAGGSIDTSVSDGGRAGVLTGSFVSSGGGSLTVAVAGVSCGRGSGGAPFVFGRESSAGTALFLFAKAWSSFNIRSSHSPLSISPISSCTSAYLLSSSWIAVTI